MHIDVLHFGPSRHAKVPKVSTEHYFLSVNTFGDTCLCCSRLCLTSFPWFQFLLPLRSVMEIIWVPNSLHFLRSILYNHIFCTFGGVYSFYNSLSWTALQRAWSVRSDSFQYHISYFGTRASHTSCLYIFTHCNPIVWMRFFWWLLFVRHESFVTSHLLGELQNCCAVTILVPCDRFISGQFFGSKYISE